jgi:NAD(P)-dependent dehydrogenase (short-subunit alcohol dehydrogenase family)
MSTQKISSSKTVLITGASTGFGRDTAETLTREGHRVFASFRDIAGATNPTLMRCGPKTLKSSNSMLSTTGRSITFYPKQDGSTF